VDTDGVAVLLVARFGLTRRVAAGLAGPADAGHQLAAFEEVLDLVVGGAIVVGVEFPGHVGAGAGPVGIPGRVGPLGDLGGQHNALGLVGGRALEDVSPAVGPGVAAAVFDRVARRVVDDQPPIAGNRRRGRRRRDRRVAGGRRARIA